MVNRKAISGFGKIIVVAQIIFLIGVGIFLYVFAPRLDYPPNEATFDQNDIQFGLRNANVILVDDNPDFSSPVKIDVSEIEGKDVVFDAGTYYWKAEGVLGSSKRKFTITSNVGLEIDEENSSLENVGNVPVNVTEETPDGEKGLAIIGVESEYPVNLTNGSVYRGEQNE
jgi:hypothetical protein